MTDRPLRIHTVIDSLTWGGAETLLGDLAIGAPAAGIELSVSYLKEIDSSPSAHRLRAVGVQPRLVGAGRLVSADSLRRVRRHVDKARPDVVHTHLPTSDVLGALAARSLGIPSVSTIHLIGRAVSDPPGARTLIKEQLTALARRRLSAAVIAVSEAARMAYLRRYRERPEHVLTVHNGIAPPTPTAAPARAAKMRAEMRAQLGIAENALAVAMVSVLRAGKGHAVAAEAIARLIDRFPQLVFVVIGDGPARAEVEGLTAPLGAHALMLGHRRDVTELLGAMDVLLHPTDMDAFPTALLEAAAVGLPVLATAVGGIPEIVVPQGAGAQSACPGSTGLLMRPPASAEAIAEGLGLLLGDGELRARLGAAAGERFQAEFTAERWAQRLRKVYEMVLAKTVDR